MARKASKSPKAGKSHSSKKAVKMPSKGSGYVPLLEQLEERQLLSVPAMPSALSATTISTSQINLSWLDNSSDEAGFYIDCATISDFSQNLQTFQVAADTGSYSAQTLDESKSYYFRVRAYNNDGESANTGAISKWTKPATPTGLDFTSIGIQGSSPSQSEVTLTWNDESSGENGYQVWFSYRGPAGNQPYDWSNPNYLGENPTATPPSSQIILKPANTESRVFNMNAYSGATGRYYYTVVATNAGGEVSEKSNIVDVTAMQISSILINRYSPANATLTWTTWPGTPYDISSFTVECATDGDFSAEHIVSSTSLPAQNRSMPFSQLDPNTTYYFRVKAFGDNCESAYSSTASTVPTMAPSGLTNNAQDAGDARDYTQLHLAWSDNSGGQASFRLERATDINFTTEFRTQ